MQILTLCPPPRVSSLSTTTPRHPYVVRSTVNETLPINHDEMLTEKVIDPETGYISHHSIDPEMADNIIDALMMQMVFWLQAKLDKVGWHTRLCKAGDDDDEQGGEGCRCEASDYGAGDDDKGQ